MQLFTLVTATLGLGGVVNAAAVPPSTDLVKDAPATSEKRDDDTSTALQQRDYATFALGIAQCTWWNPGNPFTASTDIFAYGGQVEVGCNEHWQTTAVSWTGESFNDNHHQMNICGHTVDFWKHDNNYDFYKVGGDGKLLGTCYPHNTDAKSCFESLGICYVSNRYWCYHSYQSFKLCG